MSVLPIFLSGINGKVIKAICLDDHTMSVFWQDTVVTRVLN